ncbi:hypothetical protein Pth03_70490 [Planotetraspora thailandica]|uniref:YdhG-like domain-containing protein n=1 Tax=Planotetraspora thailandica TaxID=487172 RepID=A0A8J3Y0S9_9ACTN|nr:DUF1801 domain-containing protein [Planotetraspora thailandica]GII58660.1 hypothetical protein Pth03_70490 [Planotetraspora thailandica]
MSSEAVDEFVETKVLPEHRSIVGLLRDLMKECAPDAEEVISRGSPAWQGRKLLAIISPSKTHITFAFARGADFDDTFGLLDGVGKTTRHVKIKKVDAVDKDALRDYIRQAVRLDAE